MAFSEVDQLFCSCHGVERLMLDGGKEEAEPFVDFALLPEMSNRPSLPFPSRNGWIVSNW